MKKIAYILCLLTLVLPLHAQRQDLLSQIEQNNTVLQALRKQADAEKIGNKTGIYLESPEVEFGHKWGKGDETIMEWEVTQSFDFPTAYYHKKKVSDGQNDLVEVQYLIERKDVLFEAKKTILNIIFLNKLIDELAVQAEQANKIAVSYQERFDKGDANVIELNKAKVGKINADKALAEARLGHTSLLKELKRMNGGVNLICEDKDYLPIYLSSSFEDCYAGLKEKNYDLLYKRSDITQYDKNRKLQQSMNLPKFTVGYAYEKEPLETFHGVVAGISIPLWENKNTVKHIKAQAQAAEVLYLDAETRFYNETEMRYARVKQLSQVLDSYKEAMPEAETAELLAKALDFGQISLIDYLQELEIFYEVRTNMLETEYELQQAFADLMEWGL